MLVCKSYKLASHKYANCHVSVYREGVRVTGVSLWSYSTDVCGFYFDENEGEWKIYCTGTYSQTTRKHIGWFARELCYAYAPCKIDYYGFKAIYERYIDSPIPQRLCKLVEVGAAMRLIDHYSANCRPI